MEQNDQQKSLFAKQGNFMVISMIIQKLNMEKTHTKK